MAGVVGVVGAGRIWSMQAGGRASSNQVQLNKKGFEDAENSMKERFWHHWLRVWISYRRMDGSLFVERTGYLYNKFHLPIICK